MSDWNLDMTLLDLGGTETSHSLWTLRRAFEGVQIFGGIGSGKTSGSGRTLALKYLKAGFGGLVLTVKPDERKAWEEDYCVAAGRSDDLFIIGPEHENYFDFLDYISGDGSLTENIVQVLKTVINANEEKQGKNDDAFWETALDMLLFNVIDLCKLAYGKVTVRQLYEIVQSLPKPETLHDEENPTAYYKAYQRANDNAQAKIDHWNSNQDASYIELLASSEQIMDETHIAHVPEARTLYDITEFFENTFRNLSDKTRTIIDFSFAGFLFRLLRYPVYDLFCSGRTTIKPEDCLNGKIIVLDIPVKAYHTIGRDCQILFKYIWQREMEKRDVTKNGTPVFLWADEAQNFLHEHDPDFQATARSSRIATVYLSQNLPNYFANMGSGKFEYKVKSFLGTLATKIFHANADVETNKYASELIGDTYYEQISRGSSVAGKPSLSKNKSLVIDKAVRPEEFVSLRTGGATNKHIVDAYLHVQGEPIHDGLNYLKVSFRQPKPI